MKVDLHLHTTASDGGDTPAELLTKAADAGLSVIAITDHDTIDGHPSPDAVPPGIRLIRGVEFSCVLPGGKCHILGYGFDPGDAVFRAALDEGHRLRAEKTEKRVAFLAQRFGIVLTEAELAWLWSQKSPGKPHFGRILVNRGLAPDLSTAIREFINPCRGGADRIDAETAVRGILHAGGIPVWAHPLGGEGERRLTEAEFDARLPHLLSCGLRGLECHYSRYTPADIAFLRRRAKERGLLISGGSDYHGANKKGITLAMLNTHNTPTPAEDLTILAHL